MASWDEAKAMGNRGVPLGLYHGEPAAGVESRDTNPKALREPKCMKTIISAEVDTKEVKIEPPQKAGKKEILLWAENRLSESSLQKPYSNRLDEMNNMKHKCSKHA